MIPPVYHCTRVRQFPAWLLVLGTGSIIIPRTRVYILIAVVPKHFVVSRPKGLSPVVAITSVTKSATAGSGRAPSRLETFAPRQWRNAGPRLRITVSDRIRPPCGSSVVDGNIQGHGLGNFKGRQNRWIKTKWSALEIRRENWDDLPSSICTLFFVLGSILFLWST